MTSALKQSTSLANTFSSEVMYFRQETRSLKILALALPRSDPHEMRHEQILAMPGKSPVAQCHLNCTASLSSIEKRAGINTEVTLKLGTTSPRLSQSQRSRWSITNFPWDSVMNLKVQSYCSFKHWQSSRLAFFSQTQSKWYLMISLFFLALKCHRYWSSKSKSSHQRSKQYNFGGFLNIHQSKTVFFMRKNDLYFSSD